MQRGRLSAWVVYLAVRMAVCVAQALRIDTGHVLARRMAWLFCDVLRIRGRVVDENLAHAFPDLSAAARRSMARGMWEHLFLLVFEVAQAPRKIHETNWRQYITLRGEDELVRLLMADRPVLIITGHFGNFELGGYILGVLGFPTHTVARPLDNPYLDGFVNRFRGATGQHIIPKDGYDEIVAVLARGGTMTFLADQYAGPKGCWVEFFGRPASAHKAIALLALANHAYVAVSAARRLGRPLCIEMDAMDIRDPHNPADQIGGVRELTQWYSRRLEEIIRRCPEQYWWLHRRWKDTRPKRPQQRRAA